MESQKEINLELNRKVDDENNENYLMESEIKAYENEIKKCNTVIKKRQQDADLLNKRVEIILRRTGVSTTFFYQYNFVILHYLAMPTVPKRIKNHNSRKKSRRHTRKHQGNAKILVARPRSSMPFI